MLEVIGLRRRQRRVVLVSLMSPDRDVVGQQAFDRGQPVVVVEVLGYPICGEDVDGAVVHGGRADGHDLPSVAVVLTLEAQPTPYHHTSTGSPPPNANLACHVEV